MKSSRRLVGCVLGALVTILAVGSEVQAAAIFTTNSAAFLAANPGLTLEDFEAASLASGTAGVFAGPLNSATNNSVFQPGDIVAGFSLTTTSGDIYADRDFAGNSGATVSSNFFNADLNIGFTPLVTAIGIDLKQWNGSNGTWTVEAFDVANVSLGSFVTGNTFLGITSDVAIGRLFINKPDQGAVIDNLRFGAAGTPVPEPSTLTLLGLGIAAGARKLRNRGKRVNG